MLRPIMRRTRRRVLLSPLVAAVQVLAAAWVPAVHARTAVFTSVPAVEDTHSGDCAEIHVQTSCKTCVSLNFAAVPHRHLRASPGEARVIPLGTPERHLPAHKKSPSNAVRAPPSR